MRIPAGSLVAAFVLSLMLAVGIGSASSAAPATAERGGGSPERFVKAKPKRVALGENLTIKGRGFGSRVKVRVKFGEPGEAPETEEIVRTSRGGGFSERYRVRRTSETGKGIVVVCRRSCQVKERDTFRIVP